jgi:hypothetical protein
MAKSTRQDSAAAAAGDEPSQRTPPATAVKWQQVFVPRIVRLEAREFLSMGQYVHVQDFVRQLVGFGTQEYDRTICVKQLGDFWELKEKGGLLGRINVRIYFAYVKHHNRIVLLCAYKKEDDGAAPPHIIIRLRNRLRMYLNGDLDEDANLIVHKPNP